MKTTFAIAFTATLAIAGLRDQIAETAGQYTASDDTRSIAYLREPIVWSQDEIIVTNEIPADADAIDRHAAALDVYGVMVKYNLPLTNSVNANIDLLQALAANETNEAKRLEMVMDGSRAGIKYMGLVQFGGLQACLAANGQARSEVTTNTVTTVTRYRWEDFGLDHEPVAGDLYK